MQLARLHNKVNDGYGQPRQHPHHVDLPPDNGERFLLTYFREQCELREAAAIMCELNITPDIVGYTQECRVYNVGSE